MKVVNLTQHHATAEQKAAGVVDFDKWLKSCLDNMDADTRADVLTRHRLDGCSFGEWLSSALTLPTDKRAPVTVRTRAEAIRNMVAEVGMKSGGEVRAVMLGGDPALMMDLSELFVRAGILPVMAVSDRDARDLGDGRKVAGFRFNGFTTYLLPGWQNGISPAMYERVQGAIRNMMPEFVPAVSDYYGRLF